MSRYRRWQERRTRRRILREIRRRNFILAQRATCTPRCVYCGNTRAEGRGIEITGGDVYSGPLGQPCNCYCHETT